MRNRSQKILIISDATTKEKTLYIDQMPKLAKGFFRLGHDVRQLSYCGLMSQLSTFRSRLLTKVFFKSKVDEVICRYVQAYQPHIVLIGFAKFLDYATLERMREAVPSAVFVGIDGDPWPSENPGRIETACGMDFLLTTNNGEFQEEYRQAGVKKCVFMPNVCDPDLDRRYEVDAKWHSDILWTGKVQHKSGLKAGETLRQEVLEALADRSGVRFYGCVGRPQIQGIDYLYAISGAKIGLSINAINSVSLYHSDRFTHYAACGTMVLAKRVPDTDMLLEDKKHAVYFDSLGECLELIKWYLVNEAGRKRIADDGMARCHAYFNSVNIVKCILELIEQGRYSAPWGVFS